jgi:hypothetical protein
LTITLPDVVPAPARVLVICEGCGGAMSIAADVPPPSRCYWCTHGVTAEQLAADSHRYAVDGAP